MQRMCHWWGKITEIQPFKWLGFYHVGMAVYKCPEKYQKFGLAKIVARNFAEARKFSPPSYAEANMTAIEKALTAEPPATNSAATQ